MDKIGSDISSSEDELLTGERLENYSPIGKNNAKTDSKSEKDDDCMSLSSLSSNEQRIEESKIETLRAPLPSTEGRFSLPPPTTYPQYPG